MHIQARDFTVFIKSILLEYFSNKKVLDVGSGDINGNNRFLFDNCEYQGNDVIQATNVTIVSKTKDLPFEDNTFDVIVSTECFEHDPEYKESFLKIYKMLKPDGLFFFTCASTGREEHGTRRTSPEASYGTIGNIEDMIDYYKNLDEIDLNNVLDLQKLFTSWDTYYNSSSCDLYFVGIKKGYKKHIDLKKYIDSGIINTTNNILSLKTNIPNNGYDLKCIFKKHNTDKGPDFHNYNRQYERLFMDYKDKPIKYLEIGVYNGGSLRAMRETFQNAKLIVGLDIINSCVVHSDPTNKIFVEIGNCTDEEFIKNIIKKYGTFDIILDDGSHTNKDVINAFELLFPLLNDDGLYVVEDTICYKSSGHIIENYPNHLEYFFKYTLFLNQWRYDSTDGIRDNCVDPFKIQKKTNNIFENSIDRIEYGCSYIAISKKIRHHWIK
jgi:hypothetical protein